jgi:DNA-binding protein YbaB
MTDPVSRLRQIAEQAGRVDNPLDHLRQLQQGFTDLVGVVQEICAKEHEGTDPTEGVQVVVDGNGKVRSVRVTARGMRDLDHEMLGQAVVAAVGNAYQNMAVSMRDEFQQRLGVTFEENPRVNLDEALRLRTNY